MVLFGWRTLWERKWWLVLGLTVGVAFSLAITLRQRPIYRAECTLEYNPFPSRPLGRQVDDVAPQMFQVWRLAEWYETQNEIMQSRAIAERVVKKIGLHKDPDFMGVPQERRPSWTGATVREAVKILRSRLEVRRVPEARIARILVEDHDPHRAAVLANQIAEEYLERSVEMRLEATLHALTYLSQQLDRKTRELAEAELKLHEFKKRAGVLSVSLEDQQNYAEQEMERLNRALTEVKNERIRLESQVAELTRLAKESPAEAHAPIIDQNTLVQNLRTQLHETNTKLAELAATYGDQWPAVRAMKSRALQIEKNLRKEVLGIVQSVASKLRQIRSDEKGLEQALDQAKKRAFDLNLKEIEYRRLYRDQRNKEKLFTLLLERSEETGLTRALRVATGSILDRAHPPRSPVGPRLSTALSTGVLFGSLLALSLVFIVDRLDRTIHGPEDIEKLGLPLLGVIPAIESALDAQGREKSRRARSAKESSKRRPRRNDAALFIRDNPSSPVSEHIRAVRTNLTFMALDQGPSVLAVTSYRPLEGKTTLATTLALSMAQAGKRVLLVDSDLRRPCIHDIFGVDVDKGLSTVLIGEHEPEEAVVELPALGLDVLPCGPRPPNPAELLHQERFKELLAWCRSSYDYTFVDSPPAGVVTDPVIMGPQLDGMILVSKERSTLKSDLMTVVRKLDAVNARVLGVVLNGSQPRSGGQYGYYYGYGSYGEKDV